MSRALKRAYQAIRWNCEDCSHAVSDTLDTDEAIVACSSTACAFYELRLEATENTVAKPKPGKRKPAKPKRAKRNPVKPKLQRKWPEHTRKIAALPCCVPGCRSTDARREAHHVRVGTGTGWGQKPGDWWCVPLCASHHRTGKNSYHTLGHHTFNRTHGINVNEIATECALDSDVDFVKKAAGKRDWEITQ